MKNFGLIVITIIAFSAGIHAQKAAGAAKPDPAKMSAMPSTGWSKAFGKSTQTS